MIDLATGKLAPALGLEVFRRGAWSLQGLLGPHFAGGIAARDLLSSERAKLMVGAGAIHDLDGDFRSDWHPVATLGLRF